MDTEIELAKHRVAFVIVLRDHTAFLTHVDAVFIRHIVQALATESADTMRQHDVALHFTNTETAITTPAFGRLPRQIDHRPNGPTMLLVIHHVFQALIEDGSDEYTRLELLAGQAVIHHLVAIALITLVLELLRDGLHIQVAETGSVAK